MTRLMLLAPIAVSLTWGYDMVARHAGPNQIFSRWRLDLTTSHWPELPPSVTSILGKVQQPIGTAISTEKRSATKVMTDAANRKLPTSNAQTSARISQRLNDTNPGYWVLVILFSWWGLAALLSIRTWAGGGR